MGVKIQVPLNSTYPELAEFQGSVRTVKSKASLQFFLQPEKIELAVARTFECLKGFNGVG